MALTLFKKEAVCPIGVDLGSSYLKMAQLSSGESMPYMIAAGCMQVPQDVEVGSAEWQRWSVKAVRKVAQKGGFKGRQVITAMPSDDVFIDHIKISRSETNIEGSVREIIKDKLPFDVKNAIVKYITPDDSESTNGRQDVLVMATDKVKIDRLLAIYEKAGMQLKNLSVWPLAMTNTYTSFFGRRNSDLDAVVMLLDIGAMHSNIVIAKHKNVLFARVVRCGFRHLDDPLKADNLIAEISACVRYLESSTNGISIDKLLFLSGRSVSRAICEKIAALAKEMHILAQIGDVLAAVQVENSEELAIDRRNSQVDWATAFGLSLS